MISSRPRLSASGRKAAAVWLTRSPQSTRAMSRENILGVQAGQVEQVLEEASQAPGLGPDHGGGRSDVVGRAVGDGVGIADDRGQRGPELVGDREEELPFQVLRAAQAVAHGVDGIGQRRELGVVVGTDRHPGGEVTAGQVSGGGDGPDQRCADTGGPGPRRPRRPPGGRPRRPAGSRGAR